MTAKSYATVHLCVLGLLLSNAAAAGEQVCGAQPPAGFDQPPSQARRGHYLNPVYGYALDIPATLTGYVQAPGPERGFGIVLSWTPRAYLRVDASYDALFDITAQGVHRSDLGAIRQHDTVLDDQASVSTLANRSGMHFVTRVQCKGDSQLFIHEAVIVMLNREIYRIELQTVPERYAADMKILSAMLQSWRWEKVRPAPVPAQ
jgi:hypothetical protein